MKRDTQIALKVSNKIKLSCFIRKIYNKIDVLFVNFPLIFVEFKLFLDIISTMSDIL